MIGKIKKNNELEKPSCSVLGEVVFLLKTNKGRLKVKPLTERWIAEYRNTYQSRELPIVAEHPEKYQVNHLAEALEIQPNKM